MRRRLNNTGTTLIELLIVMGIMGFITIVMFSSFTTMIKHSMRTRVSAKTSSETLSVVWPLLKEIESAGFGVPSTGNCTPAISYASSTLTLHSTASGDQKYSGNWSYISDNCTVDNSSSSKIPNGEFAVVINPAGKGYLSSTSVSHNAVDFTGTDCPWVGMLAYRTPSGTGAGDCYEAKFNLAAYAAGTQPKLCESDTKKLMRSSSKVLGTTDYQPMMDCVLSLQYTFGCVYKTSGALTWRADTACAIAEGDLKFVKIGIVVQESPKTSGMGASTITLFQDLASPVTITLTTNQRYYKWRVIERTIPLRNL